MSESTQAHIDIQEPPTTMDIDETKTSELESAMDVDDAKAGDTKSKKRKRDIPPKKHCPICQHDALASREDRLETYASHLDI
ncbi:hypothetical protein TWF696_001285 [Orbilia brochopaga]|uniref:Uncharacterized protein n=1 Tax=Orbilia brochopaga TaxID=3140254 RepID=A0AAV9U880_9PEZI